MPRVAMNGAILKPATSAPLIRPSRAPTSRPDRIDTITGNCNPGYMITDASGVWARLEETTAATATIEPTDKSMPLMMITKVIPVAMIAMADTCRITLIRFCPCRKLPWVSTASRITNSSRMPMIAYFLTKAPVSNFATRVSAVCGGHLALPLRPPWPRGP